MQTEARKLDGVQRGNKRELVSLVQGPAWTGRSEPSRCFSVHAAVLCLFFIFFCQIPDLSCSISCLFLPRYACLDSFSINKQPEIFKSVLDRAEQIVAPILANCIMGPGTFGSPILVRLNCASTLPVPLCCARRAPARGAVSP